MSAIIIKADSKSNKLLQDLAKRLGGDVFFDDDQYEDILLGTLMDKENKGETLSREEIMKKLKMSRNSLVSNSIESE